MSEETPLILGDAAAAELERFPRRRWGLGGKKKQRRALVHCENCGALLSGPYCAQCGQPAVDYHRSFGALLADAADAFLNLDERFLKTFGLVLFKPWQLTNEFLAGKRQRYVHPLRLYLIASVAFFFVIRGLEHFHPPHQEHPIIFDDDRKPAASAAPSVSPAAPKPKPAEEDEGLPFQFRPGENQSRSSVESWFERQIKEKIGPGGTRVDLFLKGLIDNIGPMVLCCIPLFALVLKLLYLFKRRYYIEHLVFALHTHAFVFLSTLLIIGIGFLLNWKAPSLTPIVCVFLGIAVVVNLLIAIRRVYRQNWLATLFKFAFGSLIYFCLLLTAFAITAVITLLLP